MLGDHVGDADVEYQSPMVELGERQPVAAIAFRDETAALHRELAAGDDERRSEEPGDGDAALALRAREPGFGPRPHAGRKGAVARLPVERSVDELDVSIRSLDLGGRTRLEQDGSTRCAAIIATKPPMLQAQTATGRGSTSADRSTRST